MKKKGKSYDLEKKGDATSNHRDFRDKMIKD